MCELTQADLAELERIHLAGPYGGLILDHRLRGVPSRRHARLIDAGFVELRGERLHPTRVGIELLRTQEVS